MEVVDGELEEVENSGEKNLRKKGMRIFFFFNLGKWLKIWSECVVVLWWWLGGCVWLFAVVIYCLRWWLGGNVWLFAVVSGDLLFVVGCL